MRETLLDFAMGWKQEDLGVAKQVSHWYVRQGGGWRQTGRRRALVRQGIVTMRDAAKLELDLVWATFFGLGWVTQTALALARRSHCLARDGMGNARGWLVHWLCLWDVRC
ncbi:unnamed protein product [Ilex paraguariensis]|uniref:Uncharacterized protein n=1 Tax=Ilex paraguariensis TaxID=185542 RepID=A0ABC8TDI6_9AQUA